AGRDRRRARDQPLDHRGAWRGFVGLPRNALRSKSWLHLAAGDGRRRVNPGNRAVLYQSAVAVLLVGSRVSPRPIDPARMTGVSLLGTRIGVWPDGAADLDC